MGMPPGAASRVALRKLRYKAQSGVQRQHQTAEQHHQACPQGAQRRLDCALQDQASSDVSEI